MGKFSINDCVIYHEPETSTRPAPEARDVRPAEMGEFYSYVIDRYWRVVRVHADGSLDVASRTGQLHRVRANDPLLQKAGWWRRLVKRRMFPRP